MYGKAPKMSEKKAMPVAIMVAVGKPKPLPKRGQRTATMMKNKASKKK
jgi:hypothetical protein